MAKLVKRKKRKIRLQGLSIIVFTISLVAWLATSLFINTINVSLTMKIQKMNDELVELTNQNQTLNIEIQTLENKDRIYEVAETANMYQNQENIISIIGE